MQLCFCELSKHELLLVQQLSNDMAQPPYTQKFHHVSTAGINATVVKSGPATIGSIYFSTDPVTAVSLGRGDSTVFLKIYDKATTPNPSSDVPVLILTGAGFSEYSSNVSVIEPAGGIAFNSGISFVITSSLADTDSTAIFAGQSVVDIIYR